MHFLVRGVNWDVRNVIKERNSLKNNSSNPNPAINVTHCCLQGDQYYRIDEFNLKIDPGYPLPIYRGWSGVPGSLDAAFTFYGNVYLFKDDQYWMFDTSVNGISSEYPRSIREDWFNCAAGPVRITDGTPWLLRSTGDATLAVKNSTLNLIVHSLTPTIPTRTSTLTHTKHLTNSNMTANAPISTPKVTSSATRTRSFINSTMAQNLPPMTSPHARMTSTTAPKMPFNVTKTEPPSSTLNILPKSSTVTQTKSLMNSNLTRKTATPEMKFTITPAVPSPLNQTKSPMTSFATSKIVSTVALTKPRHTSTMAPEIIPIISTANSTLSSETLSPDKTNDSEAVTIRQISFTAHISHFKIGISVVLITFSLHS